MADADAAALDLPLHVRVRAGLRKPANWLALVRFALVGASGYAVNLVVFALAVHALALDFRVAAILAFLVAVTNNFIWNRRWTFAARDGHAGFQAARFLVVSLVGFVVSLVVLTVLVDAAELPRVAAQAIAIATATPLGFLGNKLWSFRA
jgi:putative flippase GtrA